MKNADLYLGQQTTTSLSKLNASAQMEVREHIKSFYVTAVDYMLKKFPLRSDMLLNAQVADVEQRATVSWSSVEYFADRSPGSSSRDTLHESFRKYQTSPLPPGVLSEGARIDEVWHQLRTWRDVDDSFPYKELATLMLAILTIPHSNADSERLFSVVRKNRTETRSSMSISTLESLLINKFGGRVSLSNDILRKCKSATYECLKK